MQGIEPKFHHSLTERLKYYRFLLKETADESELQQCDATIRASELSDLYQDYLNNKRKLEVSIKNYRDHHQSLQKLLTPKIRHLIKKSKKRQ